MYALFVSKDKGNALAGVEVARRFSERGVSIEYVLSPHGSAAEAFSNDPSFRPRFDGLDAWVASGTSTAFSGAVVHDFLFVTLSASGAPNMEIDIAEYFSRVGRTDGTKIAVYGLEEVIGGRHNPGWEEDKPYPVTLLRRLFTALPTDEDPKYPNVSVVGPPQLNRYRGVDIDALGAQARRKLGIPDDCPLAYFSGQPEPENPHVLSRVGEALGLLRSTEGLKDACLVVSRHSRERVKPVPDNGAAHRHTLRLIRDRVGITVIENSLDHAELLSAVPEGIPEEFRPPEFATYQGLVCACKNRGVVVTGFGADGAIVAPHLGIPSVLFLDRADFLFGGLLKREKKMERYPLRVVPQVSSVESLAAQLERFLLDPAQRQAHCQQLAQTFPFPVIGPAETIAERILADVGLIHDIKNAYKLRSEE